MGYKAMSRSIFVVIIVVVLVAFGLNVIIITCANVTYFSRMTEDIISYAYEMAKEARSSLGFGSGENAAADRTASEAGINEPGSEESTKRLVYDDSVAAVEGSAYWVDEQTGIVAIDPTELGGTVTALHQISIESIGFGYMDYNSFVLVPHDGVPSMVMIFGKGSVQSNLYMDDDARELLYAEDSRIEIVGMASMRVDKSDIKKLENMALYVIEVKDNRGRTNLENALESELATGKKVVYPLISGSGSKIEGSSVTVKEYKNIVFFDIRSINDFLLWLNLKFGMNLNNKEKKILQKGILATLEEAVAEAGNAQASVSLPPR
ncbi:MAG: hypothetical protein U9Q92_02005 [archaeon]|nr:hypothetical protein [archaeon]